MIINELTCVTGFWQSKNKNGDPNKYFEWFKNTLQINCPYIFFGDAKTIERVKLIRDKYPTHYIEHSIENFFTNKEKYINKFVIEEGHVPSIQANMIYHEKIFMLKKAIEINPFNSEYFKWIDAGICCYRRKLPPQVRFPNLKIYNLLPKNKFIFAASNPYLTNEEFKKYIPNRNRHHYIAATSFLIHKNIINDIINCYIFHLNKLDKIYADQNVLTEVHRTLPNLFHSVYDTRILCDGKGYGFVTEYLFGENEKFEINLLENNIKFKLNTL